MPTVASSNKYFPGQGITPQKTNLERFRDFNAWVQKRGGWVVSIPGDQPAVVECLQGSLLLNDLDTAGYDVTPVGTAERILPAAIEQRFTTFPDGTMQAITADSSLNATMTVTHAGIKQTFRYEVRY
ncbi:hypothetical protein ACQR1Y_12490 [Bradyrhizobium sp. HKCCYLRH3099]|uniref:hypothetical protein n=1 Tax=Bradyrhizobium TaxID=374 RepID=UPI003EBEB0A0